MPQVNLNALKEALDLVRAHLGELANDLEAATCHVRTEGGLPPTELTERLTACRVEFAAARADILAAAAMLGVELSSISADSLPGLEACYETLFQIVVAESARRRQADALACLEKVVNLQRRDGAPFPALDTMKSAAQELYAAIAAAPLTDLPPAVTTILSGSDPLVALLNLVEQGDSLDDDRSAELYQLIAQRFDKALATAALRQRLIVAVPTVSADLAVTDSPTLIGQPTEAPSSTPPSVENQAGAPSDGPSATSEMNLSSFGNVQEIESDAPLEGTTVFRPTSPEASSGREMLVTQTASLDQPSETVNMSVAVDQAATSVAAKEVDDSTERGNARERRKKGKARSAAPAVRSTEVTGAGWDEELIKELRADVSVGRENRESSYIKSSGDRQAGPVLDEFSGGETSSTKMAAALLSAGTMPEYSHLGTLLWQLLAEGRLSLAYHLAGYLEAHSSESTSPVDPTLIQAIILSRHVRHDVGRLSTALQKICSELDPGQLMTSDGTELVHSLLAVAAFLRPSMLAPNAETWGTLETIAELGFGAQHSLESLRSCCQAVAAYGQHRQPLEFSLLEDIRHLERWEQDLAALRQEANQYLVQAQHKKASYDAASKAWYQWLKPGGLIHRFLQPVFGSEEENMRFVRNEAARLADRNVIKQELNATDRLLRVGRTHEIDYRAVDQIHQYVDNAVRLARRWLELMNTRPDTNRHSFIHHIVEVLHQAAAEHGPSAITELTELASPDGHASVPLRAAAHVCLAAVEQSQIILEQQIALPDTEPDAKYLLHAMLLADAEIELCDDWSPVSNDQRLLFGILRLAEQERIDWVRALEQRGKTLNHDLTGRIIEYFQVCPDVLVNVAQLEAIRKEQLDGCRAQLRRLAAKTSRQIEGAVAYGLLRESERYDYLSKIEAVGGVLDVDPRFDVHQRSLYQIVAEVDSKRSQQIEHVRQRLEANLAADNPSYARISQVLTAGDPLTANEYLDLVLAGTELPSGEASADALSDFFPRRMTDIERYLDGEFEPIHVVGQLRRYARGGLRTFNLGPIDMYYVSGPQADQAADLLEAWFGAKKQQTITVEYAQHILNSLGYRTRSVDIRRGRRVWCEVSTEPLRDRSLSPVWQFGSGARGSYRILCVWDRPTEEDLLNDVGETAHAAPTIVFYFGRMTQQRRRDLARLCRERRRMFIVLDDSLILHLCGFRTGRLRGMFDCSLPFTFLEPYTTTAGVVPPEMFYGRQRERDQILSPAGSCFIYGGRQLGKTALLRDVERGFHRPEDGRIVVWVDLKAEGIGYDRSIEEFWHIITRELKKAGVIPEKVPVHTGPDRILEYVYQWLEGNSQRRILLLVDEADRFLESDGKQKEYQHTSRIKGLMDRSDRRFKVVFAGLHNVQRTTRQENHPLAHYGTPICIGPLLDNGEWREARALVEQPLASLGFRFESPDLVTLILSQTNYYPSLIQLYCTQLLRKVTDPYRPVFDSRDCPPYVITARHVNDAYQSSELRNSIRQRFNWTLQLDQRYEVMAYVVALASLDGDTAAIVDGYPIEWIREQALGWWREGFQENSAMDMFVALADEMVGLGILRPTAQKRYALRSPNLLLLTGTRDDIENELLRHREPPLEYEPGTFRAAFRQNDAEQTPDPARRSPLTAQQESELRNHSNGISIIVGNESAGLRDVAAFLKLAFGTDYYQIGQAVTYQEFIAQVDDLRHRTRSGTTLLLIPAGAIWSGAWAIKALEQMARFRSQSSFYRVAFIADPRKTWEILSDTYAPYAQLGEAGVNFTYLRPWHDSVLRQWLDDCGIGPRDQVGRARLNQVTGNWPGLLQKFHELSRNSTASWEAALADLERQLGDRKIAEDLLRQFGVFRGDQRRMLLDLWAGAEVTADDLLESLSETVAPETILQALQWADMLGLTTPARDGRWAINPVLGRVVSAAGD